MKLHPASDHLINLFQRPRLFEFPGFSAEAKVILTAVARRTALLEAGRGAGAAGAEIAAKKRSSVASSHAAVWAAVEI